MSARLFLWLLLFGAPICGLQAQTAQLLEQNVQVRYAEEELLYADHRLSISNLFPNPATEFIRFDYQLAHDAPRATITIRNVLGSELKSVLLSQRSTHLQLSIEDLKPGVYFYTLTLDEENVITQKFMVKR